MSSALDSAPEISPASRRGFRRAVQPAPVSHTRVTALDAEAKVIKSADQQWQYDKLVLATGARAFVPPVAGSELMLTLNSQQEYQPVKRNYVTRSGC